jgi:DNA-binding NtrC family response regulator
MKESASDNPPSRILVVDDDPEMRSVLLEELSEGGYRVSEADGGFDAIKWIQTESFDLVISEIRMGRDGGVALLRAVHGLKSVLPVILITAFGDWPEVISGFEGVVSGLISKPFRMEELKVSVKRALEMERK